MQPPSMYGLYWSTEGEIACWEHTPDMTEPRWVIEGWAPVPVPPGHAHEAWYQCQHCAKDGRAVIQPSSSIPH